MKNRLLLLLMLMMLLALIPNAFFSAAAAAVDPIAVLVNGERLALDVPPLIEDGRTLVPVRAIAESLGATVEWDSAARRVRIAINDNAVTLTIDSVEAYVNNKLTLLDVPARIVDRRTLVPARFISESLNAEVDWDIATRTVLITTLIDVEPYSATLAQLEIAVLEELNQRRYKLNRIPLSPVGELNRMARSHAAEMARAGVFTHLSSRFGNTAARAAARGLPVHYEYLASGLPNAIAIVDALLRGEHGAQLLSEDAYFLGMGLYKGAEAGNADIFAVAELIEGPGFILGPRTRRLESAELVLSGYTARETPLTLYLLNSKGEYISRFSYKLSGDALGRFTINISLPQPGQYAAVVGQDSVMIDFE